MKDVLGLSDGRVKLSTSTLYSAIKRLLERGWIRRTADPVVVQTNRERKSYILTATGRAALEAEIKRLERLLLTVRERSLDEGVRLS